MGLFALGVLIILAAGGIDVSFTAIAALHHVFADPCWCSSMFPGTPMVRDHCSRPRSAARCSASSTACWSITCRLPSLIVTIGTQYLFRGFLLSFIGTVWIMSLPPQMGAFGRMPLFQLRSANGAHVTLPVYFLVLPVAALVTWWILNRTLMGRAIFAVGGNADMRSVSATICAPCTSSCSAMPAHWPALAGIIHVCANRQANPFDLVGTEINVSPRSFSAARGSPAVRHGARHHPRRGSGRIVNSVLVMVGIPSTWQLVIIGAFIIVAGMLFSIKRTR